MLERISDPLRQWRFQPTFSPLMLLSKDGLVAHEIITVVLQNVTIAKNLFQFLIPTNLDWKKGLEWRWNAIIIENVNLFLSVFWSCTWKIRAKIVFRLFDYNNYCPKVDRPTLLVQQSIFYIKLQFYYTCKNWNWPLK